MKHPRIAVTFAANCVVAGCGWSDDVDEPCRDDVSEGSRYVISVGAHQSSTTPRFNCPPDFDLSDGVELQATVTEVLADGRGCASGVIKIEGFSDWNWSLDLRKGELGGGADLVGSYGATNGPCKGRVTLGVLGRGTTLQRRWNADADAASCPLSCYDKFDCEVTKIR